MPPERIRAAITAATARFTGSDTPRLDAELLMAHALGVTRSAMLLAGDGDVPEGFAALADRRAAGEPVAYILGTRDFWDLTLAVTPAVLIPRPDSETLIEAAIDHFRGTDGPARILDLGTGSGALLLAALSVWPRASGVGIDRSEPALAVARDNAVRTRLADRAEMRSGGWEGAGEAFDLVLCNPPYIGNAETLGAGVREHEPHAALFAGADGLDDYRRLVPLLPAQIASGGIACVEIGASQAAEVSALFQACGLAVTVRRDLSGRDRCIVAGR